MCPSCLQFSAVPRTAAGHNHSHKDNSLNHHGHGVAGGTLPPAPPSHRQRKGELPRPRSRPSQFPHGFLQRLPRRLPSRPYPLKGGTMSGALPMATDGPTVKAH